ncbi:MAG: 3-phosphoserine/phosphohydroxythreonine transaminase [Dokdonella sp.]
MTRPYNFSAGPAALPESVLLRAREELLDWNGGGTSVMEISHRSKAFVELAAQSERDLRALMDIPDNYRVLFLQGGATQHFAQIPMNFARPDQTADYIVCGAWGEKAMREATPNVQARVAGSSVNANFTGVPPRQSWQLDPAAAYVHITPNETIHGVAMHTIPDVGDVPLIADISSNILSAPLDVSRFGLLYAGAQKNIGASGLVLMIVNDDLLERCPSTLPRIFNYAEHAANGSMLNTPNTFGWYLASLVFQWIAAQGGVAELGQRNQAKTQLLYQCIDESGLYSNPVDRDARSLMNVVFTLADPALELMFLQQSQDAGLLALKGHKALGGMRASLYNAMPLEGVQALVGFMREFERRHG